MTDRDASLLEKFLGTFGYRRSGSDYIIKFSPDKITEKCGSEVSNFIMRNFFYDENDYKGKFFGYTVKTSRQLKFDYETVDYYTITMSETGYKSLQEEIYNTDDDDDD